MSSQHIHNTSVRASRLRGSGLAYIAAFIAFTIYGLSAVSAQVVFEDDFESYTQGAAPTAPWVVTGTAVTVTPLAQSAFGPSGDVQGARIRDLSGTFNTTLERAFTLTPAEQGLPLEISFDYMYSTVVGNPQFALLNGSTSAIRMMLTDVDGKLSIREGGSFNQTSYSLTQGTWYRFTLLIDPVDSAVDSYDLSIQPFGGSVTTLTDLAFENSVTDFTGVRFNFNAPASMTGGEYAMDNILVQSIPEPAAASLGVMALTGILMWRRKRGGLMS